MTLENQNLIKTLYESGLDRTQISNQVHISPNTVTRYLNKLFPNRTRNSKKWVNDTYFDIIDNEEKAYLLGFFIADGCIREEIDSRNPSWKSYRLCFSNSIEDSEIITKIHSAICPYHKVLSVHNSKGAINRKPQLILQWTSNHMADSLINKYHIIPNKTHDYNFKFPFDTIPVCLHRHFIRGFMDGDGSINHSELRFVFNSPLFAKQIISIFEKEFKEREDCVWPFSYTMKLIHGKTSDYWRVFIPIGHGRKKLIETFLYKDAQIYLTRKYDKQRNINM